MEEFILMVHAVYNSIFFHCVSFSGHAMTRLLSDLDHRDQVVIDSELPVSVKLLCGALSGASAQSGKH